MQDKLEAERKRAREFETKYAKLEELASEERAKASGEREKAKKEWSELRKKLEEAAEELARTKTAADRREAAAKRDRADLEAKVGLPSLSFNTATLDEV